MIFYISEIHFDDQKIFDKCKRPFKDLFEYKQEIITRRNKKVYKNDVMYVLGDITDDSSPQCIEIFRKLNGIKHFIIGNHNLSILKKLKSQVSLKQSII